MTILYHIDLIGTMVFAISGALTAMDKKLDFFGMTAVAFITALGGGTLRDVLMGSTPVGWMNDLTYLLMVMGGFLVSILFARHIQKLRRTFFLFDTIGISVFTVLGIQKALSLGLHPVIAIIMGMVSAVFGGVIRDMICNEIPLIFRKEIYALTCILGGVVFVTLKYLDVPIKADIIITIGVIMTIRLLSVRLKWNVFLKRNS